jgi:hypothetical protein
MTVKEIEDKRARRLVDMNLPSWLERKCQCGAHVGIDEIIGIGVELNPKMFGNMSVSYVCDQCSSLIEMHYVKAIADPGDFAYVLSGDEAPSEPVDHRTLVESGGHNLL